MAILLKLLNSFEVKKNQMQFEYANAKKRFNNNREQWPHVDFNKLSFYKCDV